jgi:hypothetical protein
MERSYSIGVFAGMRKFEPFESTASLLSAEPLSLPAGCLSMAGGMSQRIHRRAGSGRAGFETGATEWASGGITVGPGLLCPPAFVRTFCHFS